jgi:tyrosyl-tRNA synthetase
MHGCEFGDAQLEAAMRDRLGRRLAEAAEARRPLRVYAGYDATAPDLHLGHSITLRRLKRFQELGHDVIVVIGTMTAMVGDASDRTKGRPRKSAAEVAAAARSYAEQTFTILDRSRTEVVANGDWLSALTLPVVLDLASNFTVQQFLARDNYRRRLQGGNPVGLHEFFYALLQGYDAVHLRADVQLGATEQLFNIMAGAKLQEAHGQPPSVALTFPILIGTDGHDRMSKSQGNYVGLTERPGEQFGKVMSIPDDTMAAWAELVADWPAEQADEFRRRVVDGDVHPMDAKKLLATRIVELYHGPDAARDAGAAFERTHQHGLEPAALPEVTVAGPTDLVTLLVEAGAARSRSQARRLVDGNAVSVDGSRATSGDLVVAAPATIKVGPRRFYRIRSA